MRSRSRHALAATVLLASLSIAPPAAASTDDPPQGPAGDSFYQPPSPLPPGVSGDVIWWRELPPGLNVRTYLVLYRSENATGQPIAVSGRVLVPTAPWADGGERPIVSVASGTRGVGDDCAPSKFQPDYERPLIEPMLQRGWAVAITDYEGLGTPGGHTYVVGRSEGRTTIDATRAAMRLPVAGLSEQAPVAFSGYSQGGGGAAWAGELAPGYAPELDVVGTAAGGTPADLPAVAQLLDGGVGFGFLLMTAYGFDSAYPELDLHSFLNERGREVYADEQDACVDAVAKHGFQRISDFTTSNPLDDPRWQDRIAQNELGRARPSAPTYLFHGTDDELIPLGQAEALRDRYCRAGQAVTWRTFPGEHITTMPAAAPSVTDFLAARFDGEPPESDC